MAAPDTLDIRRYAASLERMDTLRWTGSVAQMVGLLIESHGPVTPSGSFCEIETSSGASIRCQVVGFRGNTVLLMPLEEPLGIQSGDRVIARRDSARTPVGPQLLGRVLDGFGRAIDGQPDPAAQHSYPLFATPPNALDREHITELLITGIRSIDAMIPCGVGQRMGLFGGSGVGKSTLLSTICRNHSADVTVVALVGERNREVKEFLDYHLKPEARKRSVTVVATSDQPAPLRIRACFVALAVAEYFRDQGLNVLLVLDSVTRLAMAQREIGLAAGEPPSQKGYPPSVFAMLPRICERAGRFSRGSITGFFTVLVEGDDFNEPVCDAVRGILDGHVVLSRDLQAAGHYPAIDVLHSISRLAPSITSKEHQEAARKLRDSLATYHRSQDLITLGAHVEGVNPKLDASIRLRERMLEFLRQAPDQYSSLDQTLEMLAAITRELP